MRVLFIFSSNKKVNIFLNVELYPQSRHTSHLFSDTFLRFPDLLWLRHLAQCGASAPTPGSFKQQQRPGAQQDQQGESGWCRCSWKRPGAFHLPRKNKPVLKFTSSLTDPVRWQVHKSTQQLCLDAPVHTASPHVPQSQAHSVCEGRIRINGHMMRRRSIPVMEPHPVGHFVLYG